MKVTNNIKSDLSRREPSSTETSASVAYSETINERAIDVFEAQPNIRPKRNNVETRTNQISRPTKLQRAESSSSLASSAKTNGKTSTMMSVDLSRSAPTEFYVVPLNTPSAYQNYAGSIFDPSAIKPGTLTWRQKFRFLVCSLAIFSFSLCLADRMALNIAINEMAHKTIEPIDPTIEIVHHKGIIPLGVHIEHVEHKANEAIVFTNNNKLNSTLTQDKTSKAKSVKYEHLKPTNRTTATSITTKPAFSQLVDNLQQDDITSTTISPTTTIEPPPAEEVWTAAKRHALMGAFYLGYFPVMLFSGYIAELYGAKTALFLASFGSGIINILTPYIVHRSIVTLFIFRILLGGLQAPVVPALYAFCNMWLSVTEMGIFASFIKVSMGLGVLLGYLIPGLSMVIDGNSWSTYFYIEGAICLAWSVAWFLLATSKPQDNQFVQLEELRWILRKKPSEIVSLSNDPAGSSKNDTFSLPPGTSADLADQEHEEIPRPQKIDRSIIIHMLKHPSVWALAFTKLTHNTGIDFVLIEFPSFMNSAHDINLDVIIKIACLGSLTLVLLVTFVGWLSKIVIQRQLFGWSKTVWRKVFQSIANFGIASLFFIMAWARPDSLYIIGLIVVMLNVFYMFGAGGEAVAANDMSIRYPATIYGFAHSISALGGIMVPGMAALVLGDEPKSAERWSIYFTLMGIIAALGGFVFIFVFKSKLFLPSEIKTTRNKPNSNGVANRSAR